MIQGLLIFKLKVFVFILKVLKVLKVLIKLSIPLLFIYGIIYYTFYTLIGIVFILFFKLSYILYIIYKFKKYENEILDLLSQASFKNNTKIAKDFFKYDLFARYILKLLLDKQVKEKNEAKDGASKDDNPSKILGIDDCFKILNLNISNYNEKDIKKNWKKLAKIYHPDKFQNEYEKNKAQKKFIEITECKDKLLKSL